MESVVTGQSGGGGGGGGGAAGAELDGVFGAETMARMNATAINKWHAFLTRSLKTRLNPAMFEEYVKMLNAKYPLQPRRVADIFLRPQPNNRDFLDPRVPLYLQIMLNLHLVDTASILAALYLYSTSHVQSQAAADAEEGGEGVGDDGEAGAAGKKSKAGPLRWGSSYASEEHIFYRLTKSVAQGTAIKSSADAVDIAQIMARWMMLFTSAAAAFAADPLGHLKSSQPRDEMEAARAGFILLLLGVCESKAMLAALSQHHPRIKAARKALSVSLSRFVPSILQSSSEIASSLEHFRTETLAGFDPVRKEKDDQNAVIDDLLDSTVGLDNFVISDMIITNTRAGLYIYLSSLLVGRPIIDDAAIFNYLHNRYQGDLQQTAIDLILASFDIVANAASSREPQKAAHVLRSYLTNKVPLLLASLASLAAAGASGLYHFNAAVCVEHAARQVSSATFPSMSEYLVSSSRGGNTLTEGTREDFLFACCLHHLIPESVIEPILNETSYGSLPPEGRLVKEALVEECMADPDRIQQLIRDLEKCNGNVGAISQAIVEVLGRYCTMKETMSLKVLCSQLAREPVYLDVLLLFEKLSTILHPLCDLLDSWRYDEDQGESQPVYEEFGAVLLLLLAFVCRYNLSPSDLGVRPPDSFVVRLFSKGWLCKHLDELSEQETGHLDRWIHGLFDSDAGGLGDELMSSCPPQEFYLLIPTLFHNIVLAISTGSLPEDSLRSGVEYLVDTFLLPSLVPAIIHMSNHLWKDRIKDDAPNEQKAIIKVLQLILNPSSISNEASTVLSSVLNIVAKPLDQALRAYQRQDAANHDIEPLLRILKEHVPLSRRTGGADYNELESWSSTAGGGVSQVIRNTMGGFVSWSLNPTGPDATPTPYTHRQFLVALKILRARPLLIVILDELRRQIDAGNGSVIFDICCAIICAPDPASSVGPDQAVATGAPELEAAAVHGGGIAGAAPGLQRPVSLRQALRAEAEAWKKIQKVESAAMAEHVVRLYRKVEAQMAVVAPAHAAVGVLQGDELVALGGPDGAAAAAAAAAALGDAFAAGAGIDTDAMALDGVGLDLGTDLNLGGSSANSVGGIDLDQDMFSGLGPLSGWDDMDLSGS